jgi:SagB-type dehydrogenase family enzyme
VQKYLFFVNLINSFNQHYMNSLSLVLITVFMTLSTYASNPGDEIQLPDPVTAGGMPLMEALSKRQSTRVFSEKALDMQTISNLLWAANGFNRRDVQKRTAPTSRNKQEMEVYVALVEGLYLYDAHENRLILKVADDVRAATGLQDFVAGAPVNLIFVANMEKVEDPDSERQYRASHTNTGFIAQNVYLFCASEGLVTVARAWLDHEALSEAMQLNPLQKIILCQTVGYAGE